MKAKNMWQAMVCGAMLTVGLMSAGYAQEASSDAAKPDAAKDLVLRGDARCTSCHDSEDSPQLLSIGKTKHGTTADGRTPTCISCHGESDAHVDGKGEKIRGNSRPMPDVTFTKGSLNTARQRSDACLKCHQGGDVSGGKHIDWQMGTHANRDVACSSCHTIHNGHDTVRDKVTQTEVCYSCHKEQRAQMNRPSHHPVPEGKMACTSCHDVHSDNPKLLVKSSTNDTCYTCHMEKRGPFVHNHEPVTENCALCHQPHGTVAPSLLVTRAPFLCQQCHDGTQHPGTIAQRPASPAQAIAAGAAFSATNSATGGPVVGRACMNCHVNIHGSNSLQDSSTTSHLRR